MAESSPLSSDALENINAFLRRAKVASVAGDHEQAGELALQAWDAVPEPKYGWDRSYMFLFHLFRFGRFSSHRQELIAIITAYVKSEFYRPGEDGPLFWLGALRFEEGQLDAAFEDLQHAVQISRGRCFREEDPRYKKFFEERRTRASTPGMN